MGSYQSRESRVLQDVWREQYEKAFDDALKRINNDIRLLQSSSQEWTSLQRAVVEGDLETVQSILSAPVPDPLELSGSLNSSQFSMLADPSQVEFPQASGSLSSHRSSISNIPTPQHRGSISLIQSFAQPSGSISNGIPPPPPPPGSIPPVQQLPPPQTPVEHFTRRLDGGASILHLACAQPESPNSRAILTELINFSLMLSAEQERKERDRSSATFIGLQEKDLEKEKDKEKERSLPRELCHYTKSGFACLHYAVFLGYESYVELIFKLAPHMDVDFPCYLLMSPLHLACLAANPRMVTLLIRLGADQMRTDKHTFTPLHLSACFGHTQIVDILCDREPPSVTSPLSQNGDHPIHLACLGDHREIVRIMVERCGPGVVDLQDKEGQTCLHMCARRGYLALLNYLLGRGAKPTLKTVYSDTPLHSACYNGWLGAVKALVNANVPLDEENIYSESPLHCAASAGAAVPLMEFLLEQPGVDVNRAGKDGHTAMHSACFNGHFHVVKALMERGANPHIKDSSGVEPIKLAYDKGFDAIVEYLLEYMVANGDASVSVQEYSTPSPIGKIRSVTKEKVDMLQLRGVLSDLEGQISINDITFYEVIGQGSFGTVYKGKYKKQTVAVKKLKTGNFRGKSDVEKFGREVKILTELDHPNVIKFIGACTKEPMHFCIITEYLHGGSLHEVIHRHTRRLDTPRKLLIALDIARGMQYLHNLRPNPIIHRDLNPQNVLLNARGMALVADFGESRLLLKKAIEEEDMTKQPGNLRYMAPEVFTQSSQYTEKADVFSYALCLWELFQERKPFEELLPAAAAAEMAYKAARPGHYNLLPECVRDLISICWSQLPEDRPSFDEVVIHLERAIVGAEQQPSTNGNLTSNHLNSNGSQSPHLHWAFGSPNLGSQESLQPLHPLSINGHVTSSSGNTSTVLASPTVAASGDRTDSTPSSRMGADNDESYVVHTTQRGSVSGNQNGSMDSGSDYVLPNDNSMGRIITRERGTSAGSWTLSTQDAFNAQHGRHNSLKFELLAPGSPPLTKARAVSWKE